MARDHRVFLDANVLFSAAYKPKSRLPYLWQLKDVELLSSAYAIAEAQRNLSRSRPEQKGELERLADSLTVLPFPSPMASLPKGVQLVEKDRAILLAAIEAQATHLLTGDKDHFGKLLDKKVAGVLIITPGEFLRVMGGNR